MGTLTIRNLDDNVKRELRKRAAERGVSMEQEARDVLAEGVKTRARKRPTLDDLMRLAVKPDKTARYETGAGRTLGLSLRR